MEKSNKPGEVRPESGAAEPDSSPKPLTMAENIALTIKVLAGAGLLLLLLWWINKAQS